MTDTAHLADLLGATLEGAPKSVTQLLPPGLSAPDAIIVCEDEAALEKALSAGRLDEIAALVIPTDVEVPEPHPPLLRQDAPRVAFARISAVLDHEASPPVGIDPSAHVAESARVAASAAIGPDVVIGEGSEIAEGCIIDAGCILGDGVKVGPNTRLFPRVVLYRGVTIGARVRIHAGAILGADGFGYAPGPRGAEKIHHLGTVVIEEDVEIGAHTCIDRATLGETRVGAGSKLDNLIQVGHNVQIGQHCLIAGTVAIGGSTRIGNGVRIGGGARIADHVTLHDGSALAGGAGLSKDIPAGEAWGGFPAAPMREFVRERYLIHRLERIWNFVRAADRSKSTDKRETEDGAA